MSECLTRMLWYYLLEVTKQPSTLEYYLSVLYKWLLSSHTARTHTHTNRKFERENRARKLWCALIRGSNPHAHTRAARGRILYYMRTRVRIRVPRARKRAAFWRENYVKLQD